MRMLILLAALAAIGLAADEDKRRLESVTWDPVKHQLQWVISKGKVEGEEFKPGKSEKYEIDIDGATMSFSEETRRFSKAEAESMRRLLNFLARYAAESTVWWEKGYGEVVKKGMRVSLPAERPNPDLLPAPRKCEEEASSATQRAQVAERESATASGQAR